MQKVPQNIMEHLEHVTEEIIRLKKEIMKLEIGDRERREKGWNDLMSASKEISVKWTGFSAVKEIRDQREK